MSNVGSRFVAALAAKETDALLDIFAPDVQFLWITSRRFWEAPARMDAMCSGFRPITEPAG